MTKAKKKALTGIATGDWHLDRFNRLDDMARCVDFAIDEAIRRKVKWFVHTGDLYKNWHPAPAEMNVMHRLKRLPEAGIETFVVVGNHDWPESQEWRGMHCAMEMKTLDSGIKVIDTPSVLDVGHGVAFLMIPHVPKAELQRTGLSYAEWYEKNLGVMVAAAKAGAGKSARLLFSHAYVQGSKVGPCDLMVESSRQIGLDTLKNPDLDAVFLGDIHKAQVLAKRPLVVYPGSLDRVDFGEADDEKGIVMFSVDLKDEERAEVSMETIPTPARRFKTIVLSYESEDDLRKPVDLGELDGAIAKITIQCPPALKAQIDDESILKAVEGAGAKVRSLNFEVNAPKVVRASGVAEGVSAASALEAWVGMQSYDKALAASVLEAGRKMIGTAA